MIPQTQPKVKYLPKIVALLRGCNFSLRPRMHRFSTGYGGLVGIPYVVALIAATSKRQSFQQSALFQRPSADTEKIQEYKVSLSVFCNTPIDYCPNIFPLTLNWGLRGFALRGFVFTMVATSSLSLSFPTLTASFPSPSYFSSVISHVEQISLTLIPT